MFCILSQKMPPSLYTHGIEKVESYKSHPIWKCRNTEAEWWSQVSGMPALCMACSTLLAGCMSGKHANRARVMMMLFASQVPARVKNFVSARTAWLPKCAGFGQPRKVFATMYCASFNCFESWVHSRLLLIKSSQVHNRVMLLVVLAS